MSDHTPSQAEGDREDERDTTPRPTPSQAEGDRGDTSAQDDGDGGDGDGDGGGGGGTTDRTDTAARETT